jgi:beta-xylosidase
LSSLRSISLAGILIASLSSGSGRPDGGATEISPIHGYLFAHMTHEHYGRLFYALSEDGMHYHPVNQGQPVMGPEYWGHADIVLGHDGAYYMTGNQVGPDGRRTSTIAIWRSTDLLDWQPHTSLAPDVSHLMDSPGDNRGAAKIYFDPDTRQYYITWHTSNGPRPAGEEWRFWRAQRTFYVVSDDLGSFSEAQRLFPWNMATIDVILRREDGRLYAFLKDEREPSAAEPTGKSIRMSWAPSIEGPWSDPGPKITAGFREAPTLLPRKDGRGWLLFYEHYTGVSYELSTAERLDGPWYDVWNRHYSMPAGARHGCIIPLGETEYRRIRHAFAP